MSSRALLLALAVTALAFALRICQVESLPPGLYLDEASIGVEAHALAETGRDQTGAPCPVLFRALSDWKHPLYVYAAAATMKALGPTTLAVRLPAVIFGTLTVFLLALLAAELAHDARVGVAAALVLAVTPWHIQYSRMAWEAVTLGFTAVLALWLYLLARRRGGAWRFALAGAAFGLALYSYTPAKLLVPALLAVLAVIEWRDWRWTRSVCRRLQKHAEGLPLPPVNLGLDELPLPRVAARRRDLLALAAALALVAAPMAIFQALHFQEIQTRFQAVSVFREESPLRAIFQSYFAHLDPGFLFLRGDQNPRQGWSGWGELLLVTAPFVAIALLRAVARRDPEDLLVLAWLAIYPLGAALTSEGIPHASRSFLGAPLFAILAAQGALLCFDKVLGGGGKAMFAALVVGALLANAGLALRWYFTEYARSSGYYWTSGVERLIPELVLARGKGIKRVHFMPGPQGGIAIVREHVVFLTGFDSELDPARRDSYFRFDSDDHRSWGRFLGRLPKDEVLVVWPPRRGGRPWGFEPWLKVRDAQGEVAFEVYRGLGLAR